MLFSGKKAANIAIDILSEDQQTSKTLCESVTPAA
jgi:hypothetical protein